MPSKIKTQKAVQWNLIIVASALLLFVFGYVVYLHSISTSTITLGYPVVQYDAGPTHTYFINSSIAPLNISVHAAIYGTPTIYNNVLYVTTMGNLTQLQQSRYDLTNGTVSAIDMSTGVLLWKDTFPNQIMTQPITAKGLIVVGVSNNGEVPPQYYNTAEAIVGINMTTGKVIWNDANGGGSPTGTDLATPAYYNGLIIEPGMGVATIYNASTGVVVNTINTYLPDLLSSPLLVNGTAYFGAGYASVYGFNSFSRNISGVPMNITSDERLFAVKIDSGKIIWQTRFLNAGAGLNDICAAFSNGTIVAAYLYQSDYSNPTLVALNSSTGNTIWKLNETKYVQYSHRAMENIPSMYYGLNYTQNTLSPITLWNGTAYSDSNYLGYLFAVNISTGKVLWATQTGQEEGNPNVFLGHYLIAITDGGMIIILNATNGNIINQKYIGLPHLASQPIITKNYAILSGMNGRIFTVPLKSLITPNNS